MSLFDQYPQYLREQGYAERTVRAYTSALRQYVAWLGQEPDPSRGTEPLNVYLKVCVARGRSRSYLDLTISALKALYVGIYALPKERFTVQRPARSRKKAVLPSEQDIWAVADMIPTRNHRLAVLLMYGAGLQLKEVVALRVGDVDPDRLVVRVCADGQAPRMRPLHPALVADLVMLQGRRPAEAPLLVGTGGRAVNSWSVRRAYQKATRRMGRPTMGACTVLRAAAIQAQLDPVGGAEGVTLAEHRPASFG